MTRSRWPAVLGAGLLAGLFAGLTMTLVMVLLRTLLGIPSPSELLGERIVPNLTIEQFFSLFERVGGYNNLKKLGVGGVIVAQVVFGALAGLIYAIAVERGRRRAPERNWRWGISRGGWIVVTLLIAIAWIVSLVVLWPTLGANFRGLPPGSARAATILGLLLDYVCFGAALALGYRALTSRTPSKQPQPISGAIVTRRAALVTGAGVVLLAASGTLIRRMYGRATFSYDGLRYHGPNIQPITPNDQFYCVTKNVVDPSVAKAAWRLEIGGLVAKPRSYSFADLQSLPNTTQETTLMCISNGVGDGLMSNAIWRGVSLAALLDAAQPQAGVVELLLYGADGYTDTFPLAKAMEPTTLAVYEMNGEPIPERHGYPVRLIVPGMFGEKNVKWVTRVELIGYDAKGFYEKQGWGPNFVIPIFSRFDGPNIDQPLPLDQPVPIIGVAFAGDQGISRVQVSTNGGTTWHDATITYPGTKLSWAHWRYDWQPDRSGEHHWVVRARNGSGKLQTAHERGITPQGATGYHKLTVRVA